ncbi:Chromosome partitioning ATPase, Mrp family, contains Fe-S cluster [Quadrisphaera granulorum]|uniref:Mrp family chromosome partitioning ATPase n=1 Tax=Quadrisphaera granulorum TaxID=317664 RepID=A0A316AEN6_9ACTN|nr:hypothetical protein [Quadrisphaera granulorum]PWJ56081.1 Mrp family chromosome partitioning ATPase [Quadrisphaera granulorum]SZE94715.1 Chromosome partitioning ATPase, Mrp family, contains Fe-S cluster [Quadrisphaera granulorum]
MSELEARAGEPAGRSVVFSALRRAWVWIAASAIVVGVVAYEVSLLTPKEFEATSTVVLRSTVPFNPLGEAPGGGDPERFLANQVGLVTSSGVLEAASAVAGVNATPADLVDDVKVTPSAASDAFTVTAVGSTGAEAEARADALVAAYRAQVSAQVAATTQAAIKSSQAATEAAAAAVVANAAPTNVEAFNNAGEIRAQGAVATGQIQGRADAYGDNVASVDAAVAPTEPTEPKPGRNAFIGAVLAALVASAVAIWRRGRSREDVEGLVRGSGVPLLGVVSVTGRRDQPVAEALAPLVSLRYLSSGRPKGPVLVTGLQSGDATAEVALGLAAAAARDGRSVLVLAPADDEAGLVHASGLPVAPAPLTARAASGTLAPGSLASVPVLGHLPGRASLGVLEAALLQSDSLDDVLSALGEQHDLVVVAAGPLARSPRAFAVLGAASTTVAVVRADRPAAQLSASWDELQDRLVVAGRSLDGVIVTQKDRKARSPRGSSGAATPSSQSPAPLETRPASGGPAAGGVRPAGPRVPAAGAGPLQGGTEGLTPAKPRKS